MSKKYPIATLSQGQGRPGWSVIFRHPVLLDPNTDKPGRRVRRGLNTDDQVQAERIKEDLNVLLSDERYWMLTARDEASRRFSPLAVDIFFSKMSPDEIDPGAVREQLLPLAEPGMPKPKCVALTGTTGAGKTTVARQLIGTTPAERFPSTSSAKTTIHDTEIIARPGPFRAVVTFASHDEIEEYVKENLVRALSEARTGCSDDRLLQRMLVHVDERMRFNYVLGNGPTISTTDDEDDDDDPDTLTPEDLVDRVSSLAEDAARTNAMLVAGITVVRELALDLRTQVQNAMESSGVTDPHQREQLFEEQFETLARNDERFHDVVDKIMDELQHRFSYLNPEHLQRTRTGWPTAWTMTSEDRQTFLRAVRRFSSNHSAFYGQLLTPLVNGVRVAGAFRPSWTEEIRPLVFMDGEGLGHTPRSAAAMSSSLMRRIEAADYVLLVDNGKQPMQAAPAAAIRELVASGSVNKLLIAFTHLDAMSNDNLRSESARREHILASALNVAANLRASFGALAERALRQRFDEACFFLGYMDQTIDPTAGRREAAAFEELRRLASALAADLVPFQLGPSRPTYNVLALAFAARRAVAEYLNSWSERLGISADSSAREPWQRIKALARRLATPSMGDGYGELRPVADFRRSLVEELYPWIQAPLEWSGSPPSDDEKQQLYDRFAEGISTRLGAIATKRVRDERLSQWQDAFGLHGRFSTFSRSRAIHDTILNQAAPNLDVALSPDASQFLDELVIAIRAVADELGIELRTA